MRSKLPCDNCGSSDALTDYVDHTFCFSCHNYVPIHKERSMFEQNIEVYLEKEDPVLPEDLCDKFSAEAMLWLWKYKVTPKLIEKYHIKYYPQWDAIVLPYYSKDNELLFYQVRCIRYNMGPKYQTFGQKQLFWSKDSPKRDFVVIVEDIISAIKVGEVAQTVSLLGTSLKDRDMLTLATRYDTIVVWLDGDKPGRRSSRKLVKKLSLMVNVIEINTRDDPKCYETDDIIGILKRALKATE